VVLYPGQHHLVTSARARPALAMVRSSRAITATCSTAGGVPSWASMTI
jgi:hypothetical protein